MASYSHNGHVNIAPLSISHKANCYHSSQSSQLNKINDCFSAPVACTAHHPVCIHKCTVNDSQKGWNFQVSTHLFLPFLWVKCMLCSAVGSSSDKQPRTKAKAWGWGRDIMELHWLTTPQRGSVFLLALSYVFDILWDLVEALSPHYRVTPFKLLLYVNVYMTISQEASIAEFHSVFSEFFYINYLLSYSLFHAPLSSTGLNLPVPLFPPTPTIPLLCSLPLILPHGHLLTFSLIKELQLKNTYAKFYI